MTGSWTNFVFCLWYRHWFSRRDHLARNLQLKDKIETIHLGHLLSRSVRHSRVMEVVEVARRASKQVNSQVQFRQISSIMSVGMVKLIQRRACTQWSRQRLLARSNSKCRSTRQEEAPMANKQASWTVTIHNLSKLKVTSLSQPGLTRNWLSVSHAVGVVTLRNIKALSHLTFISKLIASMRLVLQVSPGQRRPQAPA